MTIATLQGDTAVSTYGGVAAWSAYIPSERLWQVAVRREGKISTTSIPGAAKAIEVAVGPGLSGAPMLAYIGCSAGACRLVVSAADGSAPRVVPGTRGASHPTVWGSRVAWVSGAAKVMTSLVSGSGRRILGGVPRRECFEIVDSKHVCEKPKEPLVEGLALDGRRLALIDRFILNDGIGAVGTTSEVRIEPVTVGPQRLVALLDVGEGNETWLGLSWLGSDLYFYEDTDGSTEGAVDGFDPARGTYLHAPASTYLTGFSMIDHRQAYEATAPGNPHAGYLCGEFEDATPCAIRVSAPISFKPSRSLAHSP